MRNTGIIDVFGGLQSPSPIKSPSKSWHLLFGGPPPNPVGSPNIPNRDAAKGLDYPALRDRSPITAKDLFEHVKGEHDDEWGRIINLPRSVPPDPRSVEYLHKGSVRLRETQMIALAEIQRTGGLFGPIGVGHGKTLIAWLAPVVLGHLKAVIMMPPNMVESFKAQVEQFRGHFIEPTIEPVILPYSILSSPKQFNILSQIQPDVIIADEAHTLMNSSSARTKRLLRYFGDRPNTKFIALSGTFFAKRPSDFAHLVQFALHERSFMPVRGRALDVWGQCVNLDGRPCDEDWAAFAPLAKAEGLDLSMFVGHERQTRARAAVLSRMQSAPGVMSTTEPSIEIPIHIHTHTMPVPAQVLSLLGKLEVGSETPDGDDVIVDDAQKARLASNLSCGFYYRWAWEQVGGRDEEWVLARKTWHKALRTELERSSAEGYDSPLLVTNRVKAEIARDPRLAGTRNLHYAWSNWEPLSKRPVPPTVPVWVDTFYMDWIKEYLTPAREPVLVWYYSRAVGQALGAMGLPVHGQGSTPPLPGRSAAVSIKVHGTGKNLQDWYTNLVVELPTQNKEWEQLIGRTHRPGQPNPWVVFDVPQHTQKFQTALDKAMDSAQHTKELTGADQRLLMAKIKDAPCAF